MIDMAGGGGKGEEERRGFNLNLSRDSTRLHQSAITLDTFQSDILTPQQLCGSRYQNNKDPDYVQIKKKPGGL